MTVDMEKQRNYRYLNLALCMPWTAEVHHWIPIQFGSQIFLFTISTTSGKWTLWKTCRKQAGRKERYERVKMLNMKDKRNPKPKANLTSMISVRGASLVDQPSVFSWYSSLHRNDSYEENLHYYWHLTWGTASLIPVHTCADRILLM